MLLINKHVCTFWLVNHDVDIDFQSGMKCFKRRHELLDIVNVHEYVSGACCGLMMHLWTACDVVG